MKTLGTGLVVSRALVTLTNYLSKITSFLEAVGEGGVVSMGCVKS